MQRIKKPQEEMGDGRGIETRGREKEKRQRGEETRWRGEER
jgi:hypothetical protein